MTDKEFEALKRKIKEAQIKLDFLQAMYKKETGRNYVWQHGG